MFCAPGHVFGGTEGVGSRFLFLCVRTHFRRYRGRLVPFLCFARPDSLSAVSSASVHVFISCAPGLNFGGTESVGSGFHVLRARTNFRRYRGHQVSFSCFPLPDSFSTVPRASGPVFMFCTLRRIFGGTEGVGSRLNVLRARTCFRRYLRCRVPFSCFARSDSFSTVSCASGLVFMFCAPVLVSRGTEAWNRVFMFCAPGLVFDGTKGIRSRFHVLRARNRIRRY
jgi:hypothetical protein